ncbi:MAG TPA: hypothetical protein VKA84_18595 [Gemmatimonadaceae bacterium]|nr:hypothetical protein [Gemmatimonadaceae bacterium]
MTFPEVLYTRPLPGGGYVAIEALEPESESEGQTYRARLSVERRTDPSRRAGHAPPVIAEARGASRTKVLDDLVAIASNNVAVAQRILQWTAARRRKN